MCGSGWGFDGSCRPFGAPEFYSSDSGGLRPRLNAYAPFGAKKEGGEQGMRLITIAVPFPVTSPQSQQTLALQA